MMRRQIAIFIAVIGFLLAAASGAPQADAKDSHLVYVGTYTGPTSKGIYAYRFNAVTGKSTSLGLVAETTSPSFLAIDRTRRFLYAVNEISDYQGQKSGGVSAFAIDPKTGKLTFLNEVPSRGADPCYVTLDKSGKYRSEEHTSELQSLAYLVCRLLLEKKKKENLTLVAHT